MCHTNAYVAVGVGVDACDVVGAVNVTVVATVGRINMGDAGI